MMPKHKKVQFYLAQNLFSGLSNLRELEARISALPEQERGNAFEVFAEAYLSTQKIAQAQEVWPFDAIPLSIRSELGLSDRDMGVDGLLKTHEGEYHAYQVKFRSGRMALSWQETSTFMGLSDRANKRILFTNSDGIPDVLNERSDFYVIAGNDLDKLETRDFESIEQWLAGSKVTHIKKQPLPHQIAALHDIHSALEQIDRTTTIMACATGKTLVSLWLAEQRNAQSILVLLPSLALVRQTLHCWIKETSWDDFSFLCVCSDATVLTSDNDSIRLHQADCDFPVTTNTIDIEKFLSAKNKRRKIIFSTYQSCKMIPQGITFDLGIFDEAHKTAGREGTNFAYALKDENISITKRLFLTATPRHYNINKKDKEGNLQVVFSMDDTNIYGQICHKLSFASAAEQNIICKYKVLISLVTSDMIDRELLKRGEVIINGDPIKAHRVANLLALTNAVERYGVKRVFTFHNAVKAAQSFTTNSSEGISTFLNNFATFHVNGEMPTSKRELLMQEFKAASKAVMSNARCLTEGVDVPAVDMVAFISPKKSQIDIIQATGRAMRKADGKEYGYILIPIFLELASGESIEQALEKTQFVEVWNVLQTLQEYDESLVEIISQMREDKGRTGGFDDSRLREKFEFIGPEVQLSVLRNAITTKIVEKLGSTWDEKFGELCRFKELNGHCNVPQDHAYNPSLGMWVGTQRHLFKSKSKRLTSSRINRLNSIGFIWNPISTQWEKRFLELYRYKEKNNHCNIPQRDLENLQLGTWVAEQRKDYKKGLLSLDRIEKLEALGLIFDILNTRWEQAYLDLCQFKEKHDHFNIPKDCSKNLQLNEWIAQQKKAYKRNKISPDRIEKLEEIGFCWSPLDEYQEKMLQELRNFKEKNGHCNVPQQYQHSTLGKWVIAQRIKYKKEKMSSELASRLNAMELDWNPLDTIWETMFQALCDFTKKNGHCIVPQNYSINKKLGTWTSTQRTLCSNNRLSQERIKKLNSIGFIWNRFDKKWEEMYQELIKFKAKTGHCNLPYNHENYSLMRWVTTQRILYKTNQLGAARINRLNQLDFCWEDAIVQAWNTKFSELCEFKKINGHCNIPVRHIENRSLGAWANMQRGLYKKGKLSSDRIHKLNEIGFIFDPFNEIWEKHFSELCTFKSIYGHCKVPAAYDKNPGLGAWVRKLRLEYKHKQLISDRILRLDKIGFLWELKKGKTSVEPKSH